MVAHCSLTHTGSVKISYTGEETTKPKTENMRKVSAIFETNKGREPRTIRTSSYWYGSFIKEKNWKGYRKHQVRSLVNRESYRFLPDNLTEEMDAYSLGDYLVDCYN